MGKGNGKFFYSGKGARKKESNHWDVLFDWQSWYLVEHLFKDKLVGPKFIWSKFLSELRAKFYLVVV